MPLSDTHHCTPPDIIVRADDAVYPPIRIDYLVGDRWACPCGTQWVVTLPPDLIGTSTVIVGQPTWTRDTFLGKLRRWMRGTA